MKQQPWFWPTKLFLKRISGKELWLKREVQIPGVRESDDWSYVPELLSKESIVYSMGVGDVINFDLDLIRDHGVTVHAFDPTPFAEEWMTSQSCRKRLCSIPGRQQGRMAACVCIGVSTDAAVRQRSCGPQRAALVTLVISSTRLRIRSVR